MLVFQKTKTINELEIKPKINSSNSINRKTSKCNKPSTTRCKNGWDRKWACKLTPRDKNKKSKNSTRRSLNFKMNRLHSARKITSSTCMKLKQREIKRCTNKNCKLKTCPSKKPNFKKRFRRRSSKAFKIWWERKTKKLHIKSKNKIRLMKIKLWSKLRKIKKGKSKFWETRSRLSSKLRRVIIQIKLI